MGGGDPFLFPEVSALAGADGVLFLLALLSVLSTELLWVTAAAIAIFGLEDLCFDALWLSGLAARRKPAIPAQGATIARFAILVPAWNESGVITPMLTRLLATIDYPDYRVMVGVYPNDAATIRAVEAVSDRRIMLVSVSRDGPTTKADCLNHIWRALLERERTDGWRADAVVLHDAEDVVHEAELLLFNRLLSDWQMVQLPVLPFPDRHSCFVSGHYLDEFAESHAKDIPLRQAIGAPVPSAGVGTAIDRRMLERISDRFGYAFDPRSLTEDYELGHRIHALGGKACMARVRIGGRLVATREYFPATFEAAIRQKGRWLTGIALAGWDRLGWPPGVAQRWMLWRDRKALVSAIVAMLAYALLVLVGVQVLFRSFVFPDAGSLPPVIPVTPALMVLLYFNTFVLLWRLALRCGFTWSEHGWKEGLLSIPRASVGNVINFTAALRAMQRYRRLTEPDELPAWEKTQHRFPAESMEPARG